MKSKILRTAVFFFSPFLVIFLIDIARDYIRPVCGLRKFVIWSVILGWAPNYLAALGFVLLGLTSYKMIVDLTKNTTIYRFYHAGMILVSLFSAAGLIWWEFEQKSGKMVFDINDIYATIGGAITGYLIFLVLKAIGFLRLGNNLFEK